MLFRRNRSSVLGNGARFREFAVVPENSGCFRRRCAVPGSAALFWSAPRSPWHAHVRRRLAKLDLSSASRSTGIHARAGGPPSWVRQGAWELKPTRRSATLIYRHPAGSPSDPKDLGGGASLPRPEEQ